MKFAFAIFMVYFVFFGPDTLKFLWPYTFRGIKPLALDSKIKWNIVSTGQWIRKKCLDEKCGSRQLVVVEISQEVPDSPGGKLVPFMRTKRTQRCTICGALYCLKGISEPD